MTTVRELLFGTSGSEKLTDTLAGSGAVPGVVTKMLPLRDVGEAMWQMLDLPVGEVVFGAWDKHALVEKAKASTRATAGAVEKVRIVGHTIRSTHHPKIEFEAAGADLPALKLALSLVLRLDAAVVTVASGAVREVEPGAGMAEASLSVGDRKLAHQELAKVTLPPITKPPVRP